MYYTNVSSKCRFGENTGYLWFSYCPYGSYKLLIFVRIEHATFEWQKFNLSFNRLVLRIKLLHCANLCPDRTCHIRTTEVAPKMALPRHLPLWLTLPFIKVSWQDLKNTIICIKTVLRLTLEEASLDWINSYMYNIFYNWDYFHISFIWRCVRLRKLHIGK